MRQTFKKIEDLAKLAPETVALVHAGGTISYAEMLDGARSTAGLLLDRPDDGAPVCIFGSSLALQIQMSLGCLLANRSYISLGPRIPLDAVKHMVGMAKTSLCLTSGQDGDDMASALGISAISYDVAMHAPIPASLPDLDPNALSLLQNTSGSTSLPKMVGVDQKTLQKYTLLHHDLGQLQAGDRYPLFGETWFDNFYGVLHAGGQLEEYDLKARGAEGLSDWVRARKITNIHTFTAAFRTLAETTQEPLPDLRVVRLFGEVMNRNDIAAFERICLPGSTFMNTFGATECTCIAQYDHPHGATPPQGSVPAGTPAIAGAIRITGEVGGKEGVTLPVGATGVVEVHSDYLATGYLNNPTLTEGVFWDQDGTRALSTGDLGFLDPEGVLHVVGRADDQVKIRGYSVRYSEVEAPMAGLDGVAEAAVTSITSVHGTRQLALHYVCKPGARLTPVDVRAHLVAELPAYMIPNYILAHDSLPKTPSGKILRRELPNPLEDENFQRIVSREGWTAAEVRVADVWTKVLGHSGFDRDEDFFDVGGDSLQAMMMVVRNEEAFDRRLGYESLALSGACVRTIAGRLEGHFQHSAEEIVTLREGSRDRPIYIMPVERGEFSDWMVFLQSGQDKRAALGVHVRDVHQRSDFEAKSVEQLGKRAADAIRRQDPNGPYVIAGFSAGANIAVETVRALIAGGGTVAGLVLVDPPVARYEDFRQTWRVRRILSAIAKSRSLEKTLSRAGHLWFGRPTDELEIADERSFWKYTPTPFAAPPTLVIDAAERNPHRAAKAAFWDGILEGEVTRWTGPDDHMNLLRAPCCDLTRVQIEQWIKQLGD